MPDRHPRARWVNPMRVVGALLLWPLATASAQRADSTPHAVDSLLGDTMSGLDSLLSRRVAGSSEVSAGSKYAQSLSEAPGAVTIVTSEEIEQAGWRDLGQLLSTLRGLYFTNDRNYSYLGIRGFGRPNDFNNSVLLLINGHTTNEALFGSALLGGDLSIDPRSIDHVEVVRGPGSAVYGTGAVFGIINVVLKSGHQVAGVEVASEAGSLGRRGARLQAGTGHEGAEIAVHALIDRTDGEQNIFLAPLNTPGNNNGFATGRDAERRQAVAVTGTLGHFSLLASIMDRQKQFPLPYYDTLLTVPGALIRDTYMNGEVRYAVDVSDRVHVSARAFGDNYQFSSRRGTFDVPSPKLERAHALSAGGEASVGVDLSSSLRATAGTEFRRAFKAEQMTTVTGSPYTISIPYSVASGYSQLDWQPTSAVSLLAAARFDHYSYAGAALTPRLAASWVVSPRTTVKALFGQAFRVPTVFEVGGDGFALAPSPNVRPSRVTTTELDLFHRPIRTVLITTAFYWFHAKGLIGDSVVDTATSLVQAANVDNANGVGAELEVDWTPITGGRGYVRYAYSYAELQPVNIRLQNSPTHLLQVGASATVTGRLLLGAELQASSSRIGWDGSTAPGFAVINAHLALLPAHRSGTANRFDVSLRVQNLLNHAYATPVSANPDPVVYAPQMPRTVSLRIAVRP